MSEDCLGAKVFNLSIPGRPRPSGVVAGAEVEEEEEEDSVIEEHSTVQELGALEVEVEE